MPHFFLKSILYSNIQRSDMNSRLRERDKRGENKVGICLWYFERGVKIKISNLDNFIFVALPSALKVISFESEKIRISNEKL